MQKQIRIISLSSGGAEKKSSVTQDRHWWYCSRHERVFFFVGYVLLSQIYNKYARYLV